MFAALIAVATPLSLATLPSGSATAQLLPFSGSEDTSSQTVVIDASSPTRDVPSSFYGLMIEDINHSITGGLYNELVENRGMNVPPGTTVATLTAPTPDLHVDDAPPGYTTVTQNGSMAQVSLDTAMPLNEAHPQSLKLSPAAVGSGARVGVANDGFYGLPVRPSTTYRASFFARSDRFTGPLTVSLESASGRVWAQATVPALSTGWRQHSVALKVPAGTPASLDNRLVVSVADPSAIGSSIWLNMVSLMPPSYGGADNGFRIDLMEKLAALKPAFLRIGGIYLNSATDWTRTTTGPLEDRPGHAGTWGYWTEDGWGLDEMLRMAEQLGAQPVLTIHGALGSSPDSPDMRAAIDRALVELHYLLDPKTTQWGARRAANGHAEPYDLDYVQIGNEEYDCTASPNFPSCDTLNSYAARYALIHEAIKAEFPELKFVASGPTEGSYNGQMFSTPHDVFDEHLYRTTDIYKSSPDFSQHWDFGGSPVMIGEYAAQTNPQAATLQFGATSGLVATPKETTPNMDAALADSTFLLSAMRSGEVIMTSYAPLLAHVNNDTAIEWNPNLIGFDGLNSFGSPSYYALEMLANNHGDVVLSATPSSSDSLRVVTTMDSRTGMVYVTVVNISESGQRTEIRLDNVRTVSATGSVIELAADPQSTNTIEDPDNVVPRSRSLTGLGKTFGHVFPAHSITVLKLKTSR